MKYSKKNGNVQKQKHLFMTMTPTNYNKQLNNKIIKINITIDGNMLTYLMEFRNKGNTLNV